MKPIREFARNCGPTRLQELLLVEKEQQVAAGKVAELETLLSRRRAEAAKAQAVVTAATDPAQLVMAPALSIVIEAVTHELATARHDLEVAREAKERAIVAVVRRRSHVDELTAEIAKLEAERKKAQQWLSE